MLLKNLIVYILDAFSPLSLPATISPNPIVVKVTKEKYNPST